MSNGKINVYAVFDAAVSAYMQPFFMQAHGQAIRGFVDLARDKNTNIANHPADFTLCQLGTYDEYTGKFTNLEPSPFPLGTALELSSAAAARDTVGRGEIPPAGPDVVEKAPVRGPTKEMGAPNGVGPKTDQLAASRAKKAVEKHSERNA